MPFLEMSWFLSFGRGYTRAVLSFLEVFFHEEILFAHATSKWQQRQRGLAIDPALNSCFSNVGRSIFVAISVTRCSTHFWPSGTASWSCSALPCLAFPSSVNKQVGKEFHHVRNLGFWNSSHTWPYPGSRQSWAVAQMEGRLWFFTDVLNQIIVLKRKKISKHFRAMLNNLELG